MRHLKFGSYFACAGHWLAAAKAAGMVPVHFYEPSVGRKSIELNWPGLPFGTEFPAGLDVIAGSPPCNGLSRANALARCEDHPANKLMVEFAKACCRAYPRLVLFEETDQVIGNHNYDTAVKLLAEDYRFTGGLVFNFKDIGGVQSRKRALTYACDKPIDLGKLVAPGRLKRWQDVLAGCPARLKDTFDETKKLPWCRDWRTRVLDGRETCFTITGFAHRDIIRVEHGRPRLFSVEEARKIMGFPDNYLLYPKSVAGQVQAVGRGVPINETSVILSRAAAQLGD